MVQENMDMRLVESVVKVSGKWVQWVQWVVKKWRHAWCRMWKGWNEWWGMEDGKK